MPTRPRPRRPPSAPRAPGPSTGTAWAPALLILIAAIAAYANSFAGVFVFDDEPAIVENPYIRTVWPLSEAMSAPPGTTVSGRPVVSLSLALNYAAGPAEARDVLSLPRGGASTVVVGEYLDNLWGYHAVNLAIHATAALLLLGVLRRTLSRPVLAPAIRGAAPGLALAATFLWTVHPIQTSAVTYIVQRAESLMGLFYLLTLYAAIRALDGPRWWTAVAAAACALGMGSKEAMVTAPVAVAAWDYVFAAPDETAMPRWTWRSRALLYASLAATWIVLAVIVMGNHRPDAAGFGFADWPWWRYLLTQSAVITHYLRLVFVPAPLVLDYAWPPAASVSAVLPQLLLISSLVALTVWGLVRRRPASYAGAWFFLTLAPTSSVYPIVTEIAAEHRMYLPLAAVVVLVVAGVWELLRRLPSRRLVGAALTGVVVIVLVSVTRARNLDYRSFEGIWADTVAKQPGNPRARNNYATALVSDGRFAEAEAQAREAIRLDPAMAEAHSMLGVSLCAQHRCGEGLPELETAVRLAPRSADGYRNLGEAYASTGDFARAVAAYDRALSLKPDDVLLLNRIGWILATSPQASLRDGPRAVELGKRAVLLTLRRDVESLDTLAAAYAEAGRFTEAIGTAEEALALAPSEEPAILPELRQRLEGYRAGRPVRQ